MDIFDFNTSDAEDALAQAGFRDVERALHNLEELAGLEVDGQFSDDFFSVLIDAPNPDMALNNFARAVQATSSRAVVFTHAQNASRVVPHVVECFGW